MTIKPEVLAAMDHITLCSLFKDVSEGDRKRVELVRAELLAMDAEVDRLRNILDLLRTDRNGEKYHFAISRGGSLVRIDSAIDAMHNSAREVGE